MFNVVLDGVVIGDVTEVPSGWLAWDDVDEIYVWPPDGLANTYPDRDSAVRVLVGRRRAIEEVEDLMTAISLLGEA